MSNETSTLTLPVSGARVRTVRAEVLEGPDAGAVVTDRERISVGTAETNDLVLSDPTVSRYHLEVMPERRGIRIVDLDSTNATLVGTTSVERATVRSGTQIQLGSTTIRVSDGTMATVNLLDSHSLCGILGETPVMRRLMARVQEAAESATSVLVVGESGTGKELVAKALHAQGPRSQRPFVTLDCAGLPPTIVASELFGHERGAFTGAHKRHVGAFERADGGTIFLDEIGELPESVQASLLGVLERKRFRRVGGQQEVSVDVRVVAATNRDLRSEVNAGSFRMDLFYRLAVVVLELPALRERLDDLPLLVEHFLHELGYAGEVEDLIPAKQLKALRRHRWPGNVRELRNLIEATVAVGEAPALEGSGPDQEGGDSDPIGVVLDQPYRQARRALLDQFERRYLKRLLAKTEGNVSQASRTAKMDRSYLIDLIRRHDIA